MNKVLKNVNLLSNIVKYLSFGQIINISKINKYTYISLLNPTHNSSINTIYGNYTYKKFYSNVLEDDDEGKKKNEEIKDNYELTNNNWKLIYNNITFNYYNYPNKEIVELVYNCFKNHLYLPYMRKSNKFLEFEFNSLHQLISYDITFLNNMTYNHYDKFINKNDFIKQNSNDFILKKSLFFENELLNFNENLHIIKNDINLLNYLERIIEYDYKNIDFIYLNNNKNNNIIINFLLWLNHTVILFAEFICRYIKKYSFVENDKINENKLLSEYINKHNEFINFSLLINEHFNNINIIINYLNKFILLKKKNNNIVSRFSIYKMCINILKKEIYDKLENKLKIKFEKTTNRYINDLFEKSNSEINDNNDSKTKEDSHSFEDYENNFDDENSEKSLFDENDEMTEHEIVQNFFLCITDFNINEYNANLINHSSLKMDDEYTNYENILINSFKNKINKCLDEGKSLNDLFPIIKKVLSVQKEEINSISKDNEISLNIIMRTKKIIFEQVINYFKEYFIKKIKEEWSSLYRNDKNDCIDNKNKIKRNILLNDEEKNKLNKEQNIIFINIYNNEINELKNDLINKINNRKNLFNSNNNNVSEIINYYLNNKVCYFVVVLKEIMYYYYIENIYYCQMDNKIINIIINGKDNNYPLALSEFIIKM